MPAVAGFNLTTVKSTTLLRPDAIDLRHDGALGDRRFLFARSNGTRLSGISKAPLMPIVSAWDREAERLSLRFPDGLHVEGSAEPRDDVVPIGLYDREVPGRPIDPVFADAVHDIDETLTLFRVDEPEYAGGMNRVSLISRASVAAVGATRDAADLDPRRFRMLVEIDDMDAFAEDGWQGRRVRIGDAVVRVIKQVRRCVMTTLDPDTGAQDFPTLQALGHARDGAEGVYLGVYADVERPGAVRIGDDVTPLEG